MQINAIAMPSSAKHRKPTTKFKATAALTVGLFAAAGIASSLETPARAAIEPVAFDGTLPAAALVAPNALYGAAGAPKIVVMTPGGGPQA